MTYNVLVADDELLIRKAIAARLKREFGCIGTIYEAEDGHQAIDILKHEKIDIILTDIRMPVIDGIGVVKYVYENMREQPVRSIIISGYAEFEYAEKAINYGVSGYLLKPIQKSEFGDVLNKVMVELDQIKMQSMEAKALDKVEQKLNKLFMYGQTTMDDDALFNEEEGIVCYTTMLIHVDGISYLSSDFSYDDKKLLKFSVLNVLEELIDKKTEQCFKSYMDENVLLIVMGKKNRQVMEDAIHRLAVSIIHNVRKYLDSSVTIGVSLIHDNLCKQMYDESSVALDSRYSYGKGKAYYYNQSSIIDYYEFSKSKLSLLEKCIEKKEKENIGKIIKNIFSCFESEFKDKSYVRLLVKDVLMIVHKDNYEHLNIDGLVNQNQQIQALTRECESIQEIRDGLTDYCIDIIGRSLYMSKKEITDDMLLYIKEHFNEDITLEKLATIYRLSSNYVYTILKQETGMSYKQHLKNLRLDEAKRLLAETEIAIGDIADFCGYKDALYFSRLFKKELGISPSQYRVKE